MPRSHQQSDDAASCAAGDAATRTFGQNSNHEVELVVRCRAFGVKEAVQKIDGTVAPEIASAWPSAGVVEPFVSRHELARLIGVSIDTVDRLVAEGMPSVTWGRRTRRFRPSVAIGWASDRVRSA